MKSGKLKTENSFHGFGRNKKIHIPKGKNNWQNISPFGLY